MSVPPLLKKQPRPLTGTFRERVQLLITIVHVTKLDVKWMCEWLSVPALPLEGPSLEREG